MPNNITYKQVIITSYPSPQVHACQAAMEASAIDPFMVYETAV